MSRIEDYAFLSDNHTAALVGKDGSIDWLCVPRVDSGAVFARLLGDESNGHWSIAPEAVDARVTRRYRPGTLILETEFVTAGGTVRLIDFLANRDRHPTVVRIVEGVTGSVNLHLDLRLRFDYGWVVPWVRHFDWGMTAVAGPDAVALRSPIGLTGKDLTTTAGFRVGAGDRIPFVLTWYDPTQDAPAAADAEDLLDDCESTWTDWYRQGALVGPLADEIRPSLTVLKGLIFAPTGGIVAAATTSLPEQLGGERNWDYRFSWLRDASMTMTALVEGGYLSEAREWRDWLLRAVAGDPEQLQIMYGVDGTRRLPEAELPWLSGYEQSTPVRIGNGAAAQFQLDVPGEVMAAMSIAREAGMPPDPHAWSLMEVVAGHVRRVWQQPDDGIWEVRGGAAHFTYSKVMAWVAADRAAAHWDAVGNAGKAKPWHDLAAQIHADVLRHGYDAERNTFVQSYGSSALDASLLQLPLVGFLPADDPRIVGTVAAIEAELVEGPFVARYRTAAAVVDGLSGSEGSFLICSFWYVQVLAAQGRLAEAREILQQLLELRNDVGLLSEEYDPTTGRMLGNFPQAFSHIGLVNAALACGVVHS